MYTCIYHIYIYKLYMWEDVYNSKKKSASHSLRLTLIFGVDISTSCIWVAYVTLWPVGHRGTDAIWLLRLGHQKGALLHGAHSSPHPWDPVTIPCESPGHTKRWCVQVWPISNRSLCRQTLPLTEQKSPQATDDPSHQPLTLPAGDPDSLTHWQSSFVVLSYFQTHVISENTVILSHHKDLRSFVLHP